MFNIKKIICGLCPKKEQLTYVAPVDIKAIIEEHLTKIVHTKIDVSEEVHNKLKTASANFDMYKYRVWLLDFYYLYYANKDPAKTIGLIKILDDDTKKIIITDAFETNSTNLDDVVKEYLKKIEILINQFESGVIDNA